LTDQMLAPAQQFLERNRRATERQSDENQAMAERIGFGLMVLGLCGATAGLLAGYGIARSVSRSIEQLGGHVQEIAGRLNGDSEPGEIARADLPELHVAIREIAAKTTAVVQQLQDSRAQAERSEQLAAVGQLAAGLAHELRNPLTSMKLLVQSAADQEEGLTGRGLEILEEEIARLDGLLQTLLDFARPPGLQKSPTDLPQLISHVVELTAPRAAQKELQVVVDPNGSGTTVIADGQQLRQVLLNLLLNAIDFSPDGGTVSIGLTGGNGLGNEAVLTVTDQGPGLTDELAGRIFEPFVSTKETGIGLGLAVCSRIVERHGGRIDAGNSPQGGATFTVRLPISAETSFPRC
jgi:signal transduction histidine kinase